jgi:WD40 repeat protein
LRYADSDVEQALAPDWRTLATSDARTVTLWDMTDHPVLRRLGEPLTGHDDAVSAAAFSQRAHTLATSDKSGDVILWDLTELDELRSHATDHACAITGRGLDRDEWSRHIDGLPYRDTCG